MRRWLAVLCAAAVLAGVLCAWAGAAQIPTFYQLSLNDDLPPPSAAITPVEVGGVIYVPYTVFDKNVTNVDLGVYATESRTGSQYIVTVYSLSGLLKFDLNNNTCVDRNDGSQNMRAIIRNSRVYLPASGVCSYFGLNYSLTATQYGTLVRITNGREYLKGDKFLNSAANLMRDRYNDYIQSFNQEPDTGSTPSSPQPSDSGGQTTPGGGTAVDKSGVRVYLAFRCGDGSGLESILNTLDRTGVSALFLFPTDSLAENAAWIRQMVGSGHAVGLCTSAGTGEEALADLEKGSRLLEEMVRLRPHIALAESGDSAVIQTLEGAGWTCWQTNADGIPSEGENSSSLAYSILETVELKQSRARVLMDDSTVSAGALSRVLSGLREEDYNIRLPVETEL